MPFVYSTSSADVNFHVFAAPPARADGKPRKILKTISIKGGANIITRKLLETPRGVVTTVTDEDLEYLETDPTFKDMVSRGFLKVDGKKRDISKVVKEMESKDKSSPTTPADFTDENAPKPVFNKNDEVNMLL